MVRARPLGLLLVVGLTVTAATAAAQQPSAESTRLFEEGRALAKDGKYAEACARFEASLELDRAVGTLLNYADCHERLGHLAHAWRLFDEAARESEKQGNAERVKFARDRAQQLVPRTSTVVIELAAADAPGLTISIAGRRAQPAPEIREVVDPGEIAIEVSAPNMQTFRKTERAEPGLRIVVDVPALAPDRPAALTRTERRRSRVLAAYTLGGFGIAGVATGLTLGLVAKSRYQAELDAGRCSDASPPLCDAEGYRNANSAITLANVGTVFAAGGVLLVAGGAIVLLTAPRDTVVIPTASREAAGLAVVGRF